MEKNKILYLLIFSNLLNGLTIGKWADIPSVGISQDTQGIFTYNNTQTTDYVLKNGLFFINQNATLDIQTNISGSWNDTGVCGVVFCASTQNGSTGRYTFNKGNIAIYINSNSAQNIATGYFNLSNGSSLDINANLKITASDGSNFSNGLFFLDSATLKIEDADLFLDLSNVTTPLPYLFQTTNTSNISINSGGNKALQTVILKGNLNISGGNFELNLANQNSYFIGGVSLSNTATFSLHLSNSNATFTTYSQQTGTASISLENNSALNATIIGNQTDFTISSNSTWNMWGQMNQTNTSEENQIKTLTLSSGGKVNFMNIPNGDSRLGNNFTQKTLQGTELAGSGIFAIYGDVTLKKIDAVTFGKADGTHAFEILYNPSTFTQTLANSISKADKMIVATINDSSTKAIFSALPTIMGLTSYTTYLETITDNGSKQWIISKIIPDGESPITKSLTTALNTPYRLFEASSQTLNLRLGDLRNYPKDFGLYFHYSVAQNNFLENSSLAAGKDLFMSMVGGFDMNTIYKGHDDFLGFGFEINLLDTTTNLFTSNTQSYGGFLYYTSIWSNRFYYDAILKYAYSPTDVYLGSMASSPTFSAHLLTLGAEVGKKFAFNSNKSFCYIEPQAKLTTGFIAPTSINTQDPNGIPLKGDLSFQFPLLIKSSVYFGYEWNERFVGDLKAGVFIDYSLYNGSEIILTDQWNEFRKNFDMDFDVGISFISNITLKDYLRFYLQLDTSFLGSFTSDVLFNVGIRWSFGDRYVPPPPPPKDPNRLKIRKLRGRTIRDIPTVKRNDRSNMKHYEGDRDRIIETYPQNIQTEQAPQIQEEYEDENGNTNRFYPRDSYTPQQTQSQIQEKYRNGGRDVYQAQPKSKEQPERSYKQDTYIPLNNSSQEDRYESRRQLK